MVLILSFADIFDFLSSLPNFFLESSYLLLHVKLVLQRNLGIIFDIFEKVIFLPAHRFQISGYRVVAGDLFGGEQGIASQRRLFVFACYFDMLSFDFLLFQRFDNMILRSVRRSGYVIRASLVDCALLF